MLLSSLRPSRIVHPNGLTALVTPMSGRQTGIVTAYYRTGSRFESPEDNGISHFLEHMLFRGTENLVGSFALASAFEELGGTLQASTSADSGNLSIALPSENIEPVIKLLGEVFQLPRFEKIETERSIIREEILEDYDDNGQLIDGATLVRQLCFPGHPLGQPITGPAENVEGFNLADLKRHHERTHVAERLIVSASGDLDADRAHRVIEDAFRGVRRGQAPRGLAPDQAPTSRFRMVSHDGSAQTSLTLAFPGPSQTDPLAPAVEMLLRIIDDGMSTRLYHRLCDTLGLCYDASASHEAYDDAGIVEFFTETAHDQAPRVLKELLQLTEELAAHGVRPEELERAKKRARWQYAALVDDAVEVGDFVASAELSQTERTPAEALETLLSVSQADVHEAASQIFTADNRRVAAIGSPRRALTQELERIS